MARSSPAISPALHPDKRFLAEPGRTVLRGNHREAHSSRHLSQRRRTRTSRARLHPYTEQQPKTLFLGDESFRHSREGSPRQPSYFRSRTLAAHTATDTVVNGHKLQLALRLPHSFQMR